MKSVSPDANVFSKDLHTVTTDLFLHKHVTDPTKITRSVLDLSLSLRQSDISRVQILPPSSSSDHAVGAIYWYRGQLPATQSVENLNVWKMKFSEMRDAANSMDWLNGHDEVESLWRHIRANFDTLTSNFAPEWKPCSHAHGPSWFEKSLRPMLRQRNRAWHHS